MSVKKILDGDQVIQGSLTVLGGINSPDVQRVVTRLATTQDDVRRADAEIAVRPTYDEVEAQGFETRYKRSVSAPSAPTVADPADWYISPPANPSTDPLWMTGAQKGFNGELIGTWYSPVRYTDAATIFGMLTNEGHRVPTDGDGNNGNFGGCESRLVVYEGSENVTSQFLLGYTAGSGVTVDSSYWTANNIVKVTAMSVDSGYVDLTGVRSGVTITRRFSISKSRQGGASPVYSLAVSTLIVLVKPDNSRNPTSITFEASYTSGLSAPQPYSGYFRVYVNNTLWFQTDSPTSSYEWDGSPNRVPSTTLYPGAILYPHAWLDPSVQMQSFEVQLWDDANTIQLDQQSVMFMLDWENYTGEILGEVPDYTPKYLGRFLDSPPASYRKGDYFLIYAADDTPYQRGVWWWTGTQFTRITGSDSANNNMMAAALPDILWAVNSGLYGVSSDYGAVTYIQNLAANAAFIQNLFSQAITLLSGGYIKSSNFSAGSSGFKIESNGDAEFNDIVVRGLSYYDSVELSGAGDVEVAIDIFQYGLSGLFQNYIFEAVEKEQDGTCVFSSAAVSGSYAVEGGKVYQTIDFFSEISGTRFKVVVVRDDQFYYEEAIFYTKSYRSTARVTARRIS